MKLNYILIAILVVVAGLVVSRQFLHDDFDLPRGGVTGTTTVVVQDGEVIGTSDELEDELRDILNLRDDLLDAEKPINVDLPLVEEKEIMVTDGVRHSVPLDEIIGGGPPKDGIPPIDDPKFISVVQASAWLSDDEPGIAFSRRNTHRFYPYQILVWHEIVNDVINGERVLISYCPLCLTGFVFDPVVQGERVEFGTSGQLWRSNLVMYDRKTDSLWPQVLGEAVVGPMTGTRLPTLPSDQMLFGKWKAQFPRGKVLSRDTGATRFYGSNPYGGYFNVTNFSLQIAKPNDTRLPNNAFVFGLVERGRAKAYHLEAVKKKGEVVDSFAGSEFVLRFDPDLDVVRIFRKLPNGREERVNPFSSFWFSWATAHPGTEVYK